VRPLKLRMCAFGPFAQAQEIDFTELGERRLFLIHGPTGAGKSSILDAISFALYGESSGGERSAHEVRSQHAGPDEETKVELVFAVGEATYRVWRAPEQERPKKRGEGTTTDKARAELHLLCQGSEGADDWQPIAARPAAVTAQVERILGFEVTQFRQVVILPQGRFRRLLSAGSDERETILSVLFQTHEYARVQEALRKAARAVRLEIERLEGECATILEEHGVPSRDELGRQVVALGEDERELLERIEDLKAGESALAAERDEAKRLEDLFAELETSRKELEALEAQREENEARARTLERARRAEGLADLAREASAKRGDVERRLEELQALESALRAAQAAAAEAETALEREQGRGPELDSARRRVEELEALAGRAQRLEAVQAELGTAEADHARVAKEEEAAGEELERARVLVRDLEQERAGVQEAAAGAEARRLRLDDVRGLLTATEDLAALAPQLRSVRSDLAQVDARLASERSRLADLWAARVRGRAALVAEDLVPGAPCPVCGSTDHPSPAVTGAEVPDSEVLAAAEALVTRLEGERDRPQSEASELEQRKAGLSARAESAWERLGHRAETDPPVIRDLVDAAQQELDEAESAARRRVELDGRIGAESDRVKELGKQTVALESASSEAASLAAERRGVVGELLQGLPEDLQEPGALGDATEAAGARLAELCRALETARELREGTARSSALAGERLGVRQAGLERTQGELADTESTLEERLAAAGFEGPEDLIDAIQEPQEIEALETAITDFGAALGSAADRVRRAEKATEGAQRPDLEGLDRRLAELRNKLEEGGRRHGAVSERAARATRSLETLEKRAARQAGLERRYEVVGTLAEVANDKAMPFERFVLATMLDEVLTASSQRLMAMSRSRYLLRRDLGQRDRRRSGGLDLVVFDGYTGLERSVATLSGGEGFLASLSLALGLADVVQAYSGGIRLDTMFVDEGFGSLDPEALDLAVNTLVDLNQEGRLVGVISHVPELRERVDARLEVSRTNRGSSVRLVL